MSRRTILRLQAVTDEEEIFNFLCQQSPRMALKFSDSFQETLRQIIADPDAGFRFLSAATDLANVRYRRVASFSNYYVLYRLNDASIEISRVLHGSRDFFTALTQDDTR